MKNRFIAVVLTLAMLCPMMAFFATLGASAALEVDDGITTSSSDVLSEEWNFDDMAEGEILTDGYINSHSRGDFGGLSKIVENFGKPENWAAVTDSENGGAYIKTSNAFIGFEDDAKILLTGTYEVSWRMKLESCSSATTLLWWSDGETTSSRRSLLRLNTNGAIGYTTTDSYVSQVFTNTKIQIGADAPWYSFRARINPMDGRMWFWIDGELVIDGKVNEYLRDNGKSAEYSRLGIMYGWKDQSFITSMDDIRITPPQVDEYIDFESSVEKAPVVDASWDLEDGTLTSKGNVTITAGSGYDINTIEGDTVNTSKALRIMKADSTSTVSGPKITLPGTAYSYETITVSFKMKHVYANALVNVVRFIKADNGTQNLFRVTKLNLPTESTPTTTCNINLMTDGGTNAGKFTSGVWSEFNVTIKPYENKITINIDGKETVLNGNSTFGSIFSALQDGGKPISFMLYYHVNMKAEAYIDDLSVKATPAPVMAESIVDKLWKDDSFDMTVSQDVSGMANDDWTIETDPMLVAPHGFWDFNDGKDAAAQNGISVTSATAMSVGTNSNDSVNTSNMLKSSTTNQTIGSPIFKLPGSIKNYDTVNVSFKIRYGSATKRSTNYTNLFRYVNGSGGNSVIFRIPGFSSKDSNGQYIDTVSVNYRTTAGDTTKGFGTTMNIDEWYNISLVITPSTGKIVATVGTKTLEFTNSGIKGIYDADRAFEFYLYYNVGCYSEVYIDDVSISSEYSQAFKDSLGYSKNSVLKTVTDEEGNTRGIFAIRDKEMYLANQPFEISFDYMANQKPSGYLNLLKLKFNSQSLTILRLDTNCSIFNYTSAAYHNADSGKNIAPNIVGKTLAVNTWYNFRVVLDPNSGHVMCYIDNVLISDYNINDVYIDASGESVGVTENSDRMFIEIASQYSSSIKTNDSSIDNLRIRTLTYNEYTKTFLTDSDFNGADMGDLDANGFAKVTGLYAKELGGKFTISGSNEAKFVDATVKASEGVALDMTNGYGLLTNETVAFEANYKFTTLGTSGKLNLYSLKRGDGSAVSLLSVDNAGKLYLGSADTGMTVSTGELYTIKLVYSGVTSSAELYVNNKFIAAEKYDIDVPAIAGLNYKKFGYTESATVKSISGVMLQSATMPNPLGCDFPEDTVYFLSVDGEGSWNVIFDDLAIYRDEKANIGFGNLYTDVNSKLWGTNFVIDFAYGQNSSEAVNLAEWTINGTAAPLAVEKGGKLYAADGTTELAALGENSKISLAVSTSYWENEVRATNYTVDVVAYLDGAMVGSYTANTIAAISSGKLQLADGASDAVIYFGNSLRNNRIPADESGVKFDGYNAFSVDFEDIAFYEMAEANKINYVDWAFSDRGVTVEDWEGAKVILSEHVEEGGNGFFRIRRPESSSKPAAYMEYNLGAMGGYVGLYSVQMELRYTDNISSSLNVATLYDKNMSGKFNLLSVDYEGKLYFMNNGIRYYLCDNSKNPLTVNKASDAEFTKIALIVNSNEESYSVWVDGQNAWYYEDGQESGSAALAKAIPFNYIKLESYSVCDAKIRLLEGSNNYTSDSIIDVDNISIDIIKAGFAPVNNSFQISEIGDDIRFVATVDTLYTNEVGFDIIATSTIDGTKNYSDSTNVVFSSIEAAGETVLAETLGGRYISVLTIKDLKVAEYSFTVTPFVVVFGEKICGESTVYTYNFTTSAE